MKVILPHPDRQPLILPPGLWTPDPSLYRLPDFKLPGRVVYAPIRAAATFVRVVGTGTGGTGTAVSLTVGASGAAIGDVVIVGVVTLANVSPTSVTDTGGNTYQQVPGTVATQGTAIRSELYSTTIGTALVSGNLITANYAASRTAAIGALEFASLTEVVDQAAQGNNTSGNGGPAGLITTQLTGSVVVILTASDFIETQDQPVPTNFTAGTTRTGTAPVFYMPYSITTTPGARSWTPGVWSATGHNYVTSTAGFVAVGGSAPVRAGVGGPNWPVETRDFGQRVNIADNNSRN